MAATDTIRPTSTGARMKVGQNSTIVRWVAKLIVKQGRTGARKASPQIQALDSEQLRQVAGGTTSTNTPYKGW
jgi:hypothetical protein